MDQSTAIANRRNNNFRKISISGAGTMFLNKMFRQESQGEVETDEANVCIIQLSYDFEERLLGTGSSVPVISYLISVVGVGQVDRLEMVQKFACTKVQKGLVEIGCENVEHHLGPTKELAHVMKIVTTVLSFFRAKDFSVVGTTVDSSTFSGYANKIYSWTLQR